MSASDPSAPRWLARVNAVVELERAFCTACRTAAERVQSQPVRNRIRSLVPRSQAARHALTERIESHGAIAPDLRSSRDRIGNGAALIRHLKRSDRVVTALRSAVDEVEAGYTLAIAQDALPPAERRLLDRLRDSVRDRRACLSALPTQSSR